MSKVSCQPVSFLSFWWHLIFNSRKQMSYKSSWHSSSNVWLNAELGLRPVYIPWRVEIRREEERCFPLRRQSRHRTHPRQHHKSLNSQRWRENVWPLSCQERSEVRDRIGAWTRFLKDSTSCVRVWPICHFVHRGPVLWRTARCIVAWLGFWLGSGTRSIGLRSGIDCDLVK